MVQRSMIGRRATGIVTTGRASPAIAAIFSGCARRCRGRRSLGRWNKEVSLEPDDLFIVATEAVSAAGYGSNFLLRERFVRGYHRASELINARQAAGILGCGLDHEARLELLRPIGFY
jgi:hypothetical protein